MTRRVIRLAALGLLVLAGIGALGAKCIENDSLRKSADGDWHIYGEIHNETAVQGADILVVGTLLDGAGNTLATAQAPICPLELSPGSLSAYDIRFHGSGALQPASHRVNVISGRALAGPLPVLEATVSNLEARREAQDASTVRISGTVRALMPIEGSFSGCAAFYDSTGRVVQHVTIAGLGPLPSPDPQPISFSLPLIPVDATSVRFWLVGPGSEPLASNYQAVVSGPFPIEGPDLAPNY